MYPNRFTESLDMAAQQRMKTIAFVDMNTSAAEKTKAMIEYMSRNEHKSVKTVILVFGENDMLYTVRFGRYTCCNMHTMFLRTY